jgi:TonB family protein
LANPFPKYPGEAKCNRSLLTTEITQMIKIQITRSLLAIATMVTLWSVPMMSSAAELQPLVVTGIALDKVTVAHPTPEYPRVALKLGIDGNVRVTVKVQNGKIIEASASSDAPMLGYEARQWIVRCWKFRPEVTGVFTIPVTYKRQA